MPQTQFVCDPDQDNPGWLVWGTVDTTGYNEVVIGKLLIRRETSETCRIRMRPQPHHNNRAGNIHGGATLGLIDVSIFATMYLLRGIDPTLSSTIDLSTQFISAGNPDQPLDAVVDLLRETSRLVFVRGLVVQQETLVASFTGTARKPTSSV